MLCPPAWILGLQLLTNKPPPSGPFSLPPAVFGEGRLDNFPFAVLGWPNAYDLLSCHLRTIFKSADLHLWRSASQHHFMHEGHRTCLCPARNLSCGVISFVIATSPSQPCYLTACGINFNSLRLVSRCFKTTPRLDTKPGRVSPAESKRAVLHC